MKKVGRKKIVLKDNKTGKINTFTQCCGTCRHAKEGSSWMHCARIFKDRWILPLTLIDGVHLSFEDFNTVFPILRDFIESNEVVDCAICNGGWESWIDDDLTPNNDHDPSHTGDFCSDLPSKPPYTLHQGIFELGPG